MGREKHAQKASLRWRQNRTKKPSGISALRPKLPMAEVDKSQVMIHAMFSCHERNSFSQSKLAERSGLLTRQGCFGASVA